VDLLCIAGFLGSGKTTVLVELARLMTRAGLRLVIVENEIGEVGVDGGYVREQGLVVQELFGGCICCTLQSRLVETLRDLERRYDPDWAIVEPTGLAAPAEILAIVAELMPQVATLRTLTLVDAARWEMLVQVVEPLIAAQLVSADVVAVNKIDRVDDEALRDIDEGVRRANPKAPILRVSATSGMGLAALYEALV
jgi:G3E family GTPase